jgi:hypothetical protein
MEEENGNDIYTIIIVATAILIIIVLAFLYYYFTTKSASLVVANTTFVAGVKKQNGNLTKVIFFKPSEVLPQSKEYPQKSGNCWVSSIAEPFREDAFRCTVDNAIYDPCFQTSQDGFVFCQPNPLAPEAFLIKLTKPLPLPDAPQNKQSNWAWFVKLADGTYCSPFTGTRPFFGAGPDAKVAYYGCNSTRKTEQIVLMGDLLAGNVWTANKAVLIQQGQNWVIKSSEKVEADTIWQ